ncbi:hypothetical protein CHGG_10541 [Chaetomium globosum CBS 148.51]|uniref:Uncharacterized protein n=1 Tax=Chaetomium globosum (strain ATCC 6205 / CBS 148.51 / DSM 1962 / NBRC 6347 / NRRL 1970) TaxID=306901 RepID=Q2GNB3_CHAGB|nr:uncharacterized protein CHGG_10541 [Chaetomium globosum CBS 148.51]EAQ84137.1 hypothetical protein CHGG_10541 [Chaetomium globosum CBS 148.51]
MTPPSPGYGDAAKAAHLIKAAKELLLGAGIEDFVALVNENTRLKDEKKTLEIDVNSRDRKIAELNHKMDVAKSQLTRRDRRSKLNKIFLSARDMAETYFGDMPPQLRSNSALWDNLKRHPAFRKDIPIPLSGTLVAKEMRMAAFLAFVAHEMRHNIFQPTYLLPDVGLARILDNLGDKDSDREAHFRSVLVRLADLSPSNTNAVIVSHINVVMASVAEYVHDLIPEKSQPSFDVKFRNLCTEAAEQWKFIQRLDGKIEFDVSPDVANPLYNPTSTTNSEPGPSNNSNNTTTNTNNAKSRPNPNNKKSSNPTPATTATTTTTTTDRDTPNLLTDAVVIWPAFYNQSTDEQETLMPGFLLTAGQVAVAKAEEKKTQLQQQGQQATTSQRRAQRQQTRSSRAVSMSAGVGSGAAGVLGLGGLGLEGGGGGVLAAQSAVSGGSGSGTGSFLSQASGGVL